MYIDTYDEGWNVTHCIAACRLRGYATVTVYSECTHVYTVLQQ